MPGRERAPSGNSGSRLSQKGPLSWICAPSATDERAVREPPLRKTINSGAIMGQLPFIQDFLPLIAPVGQFSINSA